MTESQKRNISTIEQIHKKDYSHLEQCFSEPDFLLNMSILMDDGYTYYYKTWSKKYYANGNIITADFPYKKKVYRIKTFDATLEIN